MVTIVILSLVGCAGENFCPPAASNYVPTGPAIEYDEVATACLEGECSTRCTLSACTVESLTCEDCARVEAWAEQTCPRCLETEGVHTDLDYSIGCGR